MYLFLLAAMEVGCESEQFTQVAMRLAVEKLTIHSWHACCDADGITSPSADGSFLYPIEINEVGKMRPGAVAIESNEGKQSLRFDNEKGFRQGIIVQCTDASKFLLPLGAKVSMQGGETAGYESASDMPLSGVAHLPFRAWGV